MVIRRYALEVPSGMNRPEPNRLQHPAPSNRHRILEAVTVSRPRTLLTPSTGAEHHTISRYRPESIDDFVRVHGDKYPKAVAKLVKDRDVLLTFYDFPAAHWVHLRTTNPIESTSPP